MLQTFVPIKLRFLKVADEGFKHKYANVPFELIVKLVHIYYPDTDRAEGLAKIIISEYGLPLSEDKFDWKRTK